MDHSPATLEVFLWWITERHSIHLKKLRNEPWPWTEDDTMQQYQFSNPYRENDKTTVWFRKYIRDPLRDSPDVLMATVIFRWFSYIETGEALLKADLFQSWSRKRCEALLETLPRLTTGAFMVKTPASIPKTRSIPDLIQNVWSDRRNLIRRLHACDTLEGAHKLLCTYPYLGNFMSYEIVTDLRHTYFLEESTDINQWACLGPGALHGIRRIFNIKASRNHEHHPKGWRDMILFLLDQCHTHLPKWVRPKFEMREVEHSLCEFNKYMNATRDGRKLKRLYQPPAA